MDRLDDTRTLPRRRFDRSSFTTVDQALGREWLVTNGIGGFASGTVALANTRRYHGLLIASLRPPVDRVAMLAKLDVLARYRGQAFALGCNEFGDGTLDPLGFRYLARFELDGQTPVWTYALADARLEQRIWMAAGQNTVYVGFRLMRAAEPVDLELVPLCAARDYHSHQHAFAPFHIEGASDACRVVAHEGAHPYRLALEGGEFRAGGDWYWRFRHRLEAQRGLDASEDLFRAGTFVARLSPGESSTFVASAELTNVVEPPAASARRETQRQLSLLHGLPPATPAWVRTLTVAADQYLVARSRRASAAESGQRAGATVIAGYPWFADWGRDTMIALPGLALATGRHAEAASILRTFAAHASEGMLPNRFPDGGEAPEYNTVDATLWFFHAIDSYLRATGDLEFLREMFPALEDIVSWHVRGTRHGIGVDNADGLLRAGEPGVQLTWMDAKIGDWVVTPRIGKPVEINALWHYALAAMADWARALGSGKSAADYARRASRVASSFISSFWCEDTGHLHDVVDAPGSEPDRHGRRVDRSLRPNQIFAVSLGRHLVGPGHARAIVDACARELLTPVGLRSLSPRDPAYVARYEGGPRERDAAYHQGTVWSWLLGPFALAHHSVYGDAAYALSLLEDLSLHLDEACIGQISEIFDGEPPHAPRGCFAQAWSVAETLRAWHILAGEPVTLRARLRARARSRARPATTGVSNHD